VSFQLEEDISNICYKHNNAAHSGQLKNRAGSGGSFPYRISEHQWQHVAQQPQ